MLAKRTLQATETASKDSIRGQPTDVSSKQALREGDCGGTCMMLQIVESSNDFIDFPLNLPGKQNSCDK